MQHFGILASAESWTGFPCIVTVTNVGLDSGRRSGQLPQVVLTVLEKITKNNVGTYTDKIISILVFLQRASVFGKQLNIAPER